MMKISLNFCSLIIIVFIFISCSKEVNNNIPTQQIPTPNDRLVFQSFKDYIGTYEILRKFKTEEDLRFWAQSKNHTTLLDSQDTLINNYSSVLRTILNKDYEFEIGDSIVLFNKGELYAYSKVEANKISLLENPEKFRKIGSIQLTYVGEKRTKSTILGANTRNAEWQPEFTLHSYKTCQGPLQTGLSGMRKFISEIYDETTRGGAYYYSNLWLRIKLEERTPNINWRACSNQREIEYQVSDSAIYWIYYQPTTFYYNVSGLYTCNQTGIVTTPINVSLVSVVSYYYNYFPLPYWDVTMTGFISLHILGDDNYKYVPDESGPYMGELW